MVSSMLGQDCVVYFPTRSIVVCFVRTTCLNWNQRCAVFAAFMLVKISFLLLRRNRRQRRHHHEIGGIQTQFRLQIGKRSSRFQPSRCNHHHSASTGKAQDVVFDLNVGGSSKR